jgi:hypothetical protein
MEQFILTKFPNRIEIGFIKILSIGNYFGR